MTGPAAVVHLRDGQLPACGTTRVEPRPVDLSTDVALVDCSDCLRRLAALVLLGGLELRR